MNQAKVEEMLEEVTTFLCSCGELPALKAVDDDFQRAEDHLTQELTRLFVRVENRIISELVSKGYIPTASESRRVFVEEFLRVIADEFTKVLMEAAVSEQRRGRVITFQSLQNHGMQVRFTEFDKWTADYLKDKVYTFSQSTFDALVSDVADALHQAYEHGLGINDAARELKRIFRGLRDYRLRLIARTEINSAQNEGTQKTMEEYGVQYKQWLTARDSRVRGNKPTDKANHIKLHGEVVGINERFSNGLYIPGDRSGSIAEWINCRCRIRPYIT